MDVTDLARRLLRRRWAVLVVILVAIAAGGVTGATATSSSQSSAAVVIVPPQLSGQGTDQNPLLSLDNNLAQLATVLAGAMQSSQVAEALTKQGGTGTFTISTTTSNNPSFAQLSPQLVFTVTGASSAIARATARGLVAQARTQLDGLQARAGVKTSARASIVEVVAPTTPAVVGSGRLTAAGSIGLAILILGLLAVLLVDELIARRFRRPDPGRVPERVATHVTHHRSIDPDDPHRPADLRSR